MCAASAHGYYLPLQCILQQTILEISKGGCTQSFFPVLFNDSHKDMSQSVMQGLKNTFFFSSGELIVMYSRATPTFIQS